MRGVVGFSANVRFKCELRTQREHRAMSKKCPTQTSAVFAPAIEVSRRGRLDNEAPRYPGGRSRPPFTVVKAGRPFIFRRIGRFGIVKS
jgi:hypothetical protein